MGSHPAGEGTSSPDILAAVRLRRLETDSLQGTDFKFLLIVELLSPLICQGRILAPRLLLTSLDPGL